MTKEEFLSALAKNNIDVKVHFDDSAMSEGFIVRKNHFRYETLYCERGKEYDVIGHPSESDALIFLWNRINKNINNITNGAEKIYCFFSSVQYVCTITSSGE